ncbi:hypothetical protein [Streptomyces sp. 351MFTsu5.1]|uniref:hypothetical protein n=1 Tax=Streptomyces sp. 351MFTsu5.1 TaxID=1172180 RepID=UPI00037781A3|nr:hypothetical protein [Streptomyces sp. 351MFTsu5.1]
MNHDLYAAMHTAGAWLAERWTGLAAWGIAIAGLTVIAWVLWPRDDYRSRNDQTAARLITALEARPEPDQPGSDEQLLAACQQICPELARKENES